MISIVKHHKMIVAVLLLLLFGKLILIQSGLLDDTDELPFLEMLRQSDLLWKGNADAWNKQVIGLWSTYPETAIRLLQSVFLNAYADAKGIDPITNEALLIMGGFNVLTSLFIALVFYLILLRLGFSKAWSVVGVLLYSAFLNTNLYVKHILPYDSSLLFHMISLLILMKEHIPLKRVLLSGLFCALGYYTYHGNFMFLFIAWAYLMFHTRKHWSVYVMNTFVLAAPSLIALGFLEWLSRKSGKGFFEHTILFSGTIYHGSPEETLPYLFIYFFEVERWWGIGFLVFIFAGLFMLFKKWRVLDRSMKVFALTGIGGYLVFGILAHLTGYMVFYGRTFHMYYPFLVVVALVFLSQYKQLLVPVALLSILQFGFVIKELQSIGYPRSMVFEFDLFDDTDKTRFENELDIGILYNHQLRYFHLLDWDLATYRLPKPSAYNIPPDSLVLLNFAFFYHYPDTFIQSYQPFEVPPNFLQKTERLHFMSHPAYTFEYCTRAGRKFFLEKKLKIGIYERKDF